MTIIMVSPVSLPSAGTSGNFISSLDANTIDITCAVIGGAFTLIAACVGVRAAFQQIRKQFEHKVVHTAWQELQRNLFAFDSALSNYSVIILNLKYYLKSYANPLVNGGEQYKYQSQKYQEFFDSHMEMQKAYVNFLVSFDNHEVIFLDLREMKELFTKEMRVFLEDKFADFSGMIFPESVGEMQTHSQAALEKMIDEQYLATVKLSGYLWDIRVELQNETLGKILSKSVPRRQPDKGMKVLTKKGWKTQKKQPQRS